MSGFPYRHDETNDADIYTIRFDMGINWSLFENVLNICSILKKKIRAEGTINIVILKIQNKQEINNQYNIRQIKLICEFLANLLYKKTTMSYKLTVQLYLIRCCTGSS